MANLKTLKTRIRSVKSTQKMTKAMKMVAASRLKKAKQLAEISRPFAEKIREMTSSLASNIAVRGGLKDEFPLLTGRGGNEKHLLLVISSDRGLCGGLNSATVKFTKNKVNELISQGREVKVICIGKKAYDQLKNPLGSKIIDNISGLFKSQVTIEIAEKLSSRVIDMFNDNEFDICEVIYSKFKSAIYQEQVCNQIIPATISYNQAFSNLESPITYEPSEEEVLESLLPRNIVMQIYNYLLENSASEQGARMSAMESASNNAGKMIKNLTLVYNRTRQANITKELIDIVSGANSV
jgi:F-type H+-transporting ATPase subunit gamma